MFQDLVVFLSSRQVKISHKGITVLIIILLVLVVDNIVGFSYYYNNNSKLSELEVVSQLKGDSLLSVESKQNILDIEKSINERKNIIDYVSSIRLTKTEQEVPRNNLLLFFLSSWFSIFFGLIAFPVSLLMASGGRKIKCRHWIGPILICNIVVVIISLISYFLMDLIPMIGTNWTVNYIIATVFQPVVAFTSVRIFIKDSDKKENTIK